MKIPLAALALALVSAALAQGGPAAVDGPGDSAVAAEALLARGALDEAAAMFARVLEAEPASEAGISGRVRALIRQDSWQLALDEARAFHDLHPTAGAAGALAEALLRAGRLAEARALLAPVVAGEAPDGRALVNFARLLAAGGEAEAEAWATRAVEAAPEDRDVLLWASEITGDRARTIALLGRYLERADGDDPDRVTAAGETRAFLERIGDRRFWVPARRPERLELRLRPVPGNGGPAGYAIEMTGAEPGKKVRLLLDTGSTGLFMVERAARKLGLEALDAQTVFGGGGDERHANRRGVLPRVAFGELQFDDALLSTNDRPIHPTGAYQGVISLAAFAGYRVTLDLAERRLILEPPEESPRGVPYWIVSGQWLVEAAAEEDRGLFLLDTGASSSVLGAAFASGLDGARIGDATEVSGYGGSMSGARWIHGARVRLQGRTTPGRPLRVVDLALRSRLGGVELAGFAGLDLLDRARLVVDTTRQRVAIDEPER